MAWVNLLGFSSLTSVGGGHIVHHRPPPETSPRSCPDHRGVLANQCCLNTEKNAALPLTGNCCDRSEIAKGSFLRAVDTSPFGSFNEGNGWRTDGTVLSTHLKISVTLSRQLCSRVVAMISTLLRSRFSDDDIPQER